MILKALKSVLLLGLLSLPFSAWADDLAGAEQLLCASVKATECWVDGECLQGEPEDWNIPRFIRVDLAAKTLSTTQASGEKRTTPLTSLEVSGNQVFIHASQTGRAVSMVLNQRSGVASAAIVLDGHVLTVFAHCTPLDDRK